MTYPARFISFEGTEGVGKTTAIDHLCAHLEKLGIRYERTREPGGSQLGEDIRRVLLNPDSRLDVDTELLLFFAARADHLNRLILPALAAGKWVVCDRFVDSTVAYQGYGRWQGDVARLKKIQLLADHFVLRLPDVTLWLDMPVAAGMARAAKRSAADRFEQEDLDFFARVHQGFYQAWQAEPERIHRIDATGAITEVQTRIYAALGLAVS